MSDTTLKPSGNENHITISAFYCINFTVNWYRLLYSKLVLTFVCRALSAKDFSSSSSDSRLFSELMEICLSIFLSLSLLPSSSDILFRLRRRLVFDFLVTDSPVRLSLICDVSSVSSSKKDFEGPSENGVMTRRLIQGTCQNTKTLNKVIFMLKIKILHKSLSNQVCLPVIVNILHMAVYYI